MGICKERAWEALNDLNYEKVTGTKEELKAANYFLNKCLDAGVDACLEYYKLKMPKVSKATLVVLEPEYKEYEVVGISGTTSTSEEGIIGGFKYIEDALDANLTDIKGKICLTQARMTEELASKLLAKGAIGYIQIQGSFYDEEALTHELYPTNARGIGNLPGVSIHINDAQEMIQAHITQMKMILLEDNDNFGVSQNVVACIEGSDELLKKEVVVFSAHYDSVPFSNGVWDNATGSVNLLELMYYYKENPPKRTVKFVWCGSEEVGLVGSNEYCLRHQEELKDVIFNINFDMTGVTVGYELFVCSASESTKGYVDTLAKLEGYAMHSRFDLYPSDSTSFALYGVPSCSFARLAPSGGKRGHNRYDDMSYLDADSFMITLNFALTLANQIINAPVNIIPRTFSKEVEECIKVQKDRYMNVSKKMTNR